MKIVFVCGSPKEDSLSAKIIEQMIPYVKGHQYGILNVDENLNRHTALQIMDMADGIVFVSPVYMGSLPSSMLGFLSDLELHMRERKARVTAIVHGDLFDTDDPNINISLEKYEKREENILCAEFEMIRIPDYIAKDMQVGAKRYIRR